MPLYDYKCLGCADAPEGHVHEHYYALASQAPAMRSCATCGAHAVRQLPLFAALNFFSEANGQVIQNLAPGVPITSHAQHQRLMRAKGLEPATQWHTSDLKRTDGLTPIAKPPHPHLALKG